MPSSKTPAEILDEFIFNFTWHSENDEGMLRTEPTEAKAWLRSSMQSLLQGVMEKMPLKAIPLPGKSLRKVNLGYNEAITDCLAVIQSTIDSIKE